MEFKLTRISWGKDSSGDEDEEFVQLNLISSSFSRHVRFNGSKLAEKSSKLWLSLEIRILFLPYEKLRLFVSAIQCWLQFSLKNSSKHNETSNPTNQGKHIIRAYLLWVVKDWEFQFQVCNHGYFTCCLNFLLSLLKITQMNKRR